MSRIGRLPVSIPEGVKVTIQGSHVEVEGPKGKEGFTFHAAMEISQENGHLVVRRPSDNRRHRALHGLTRALLANMVEGVTNGFRRELVITGTGYRARMEGGTLVINIGYSHPVHLETPEGLQISVAAGGRNIVVEGTNKQRVGEMAAKIRAVRKPEPYRGKGIAYAGEQIRRKAGKAGRVGVIGIGV